MSVVFRCTATTLAVVVSASAFALPRAPSGRILFHESWDQYRAVGLDAISIGSGPTHGKWIQEFSDNNAWVLHASESCSENSINSQSCRPVQAPPQDVWDAPFMMCFPDGNSPGSSVWLPFGRHGLNRIRYEFSKPYPTVGAVDAFIWVKNKENMRNRGVTLILQTPIGKEAKIAFGMWAGSTSPSYKIEGIRIGQPGYDDGIYHRLPEISLLGEGNPPTCANTWNDFIIDIGKTIPGKLVFRYRNHTLDDKKSHAMAKPLDLLLGRTTRPSRLLL